MKEFFMGTGLLPPMICFLSLTTLFSQVNTGFENGLIGWTIEKEHNSSRITAFFHFADLKDV